MAKQDKLEKTAKLSLLDKIKKTSTIKESSVLSSSKFFNLKDTIPTQIPIINIAFSGDINGGFSPGITTWAGPSKHFKTAFSLLMAKSYQDKYEDSVVLFYDSEFGTPQSYFKSFGIDIDRVVHTPIKNVEELKFDIMQQLENLERGDKIIIVIDSIGNLASKKEVDDALEAKSAADMSRAKQLKSLFRMVTPHLMLKDIPMVVINHTYKTLELYSKDVLGGGTGAVYSSDNIFILGRQQEKEGTDVIGFNFIINVEKSRYVKEKSKIPVNVSFDKGISPYSGLLELALESGHVIKPSNGWYSKANVETGEIEEKKYREKETDTKDFWKPILDTPSFNEFINKKYKISYNDIIQSNTDIDTLEELQND